ncbi:MAG: hypothetical protein CL608_07855 [Anaerolineaceae bacterium]|nr:hypothetical protein [Anaerolineaceae bacterium]
MPYQTTWEKHGIMWEFFGDVTAQEIEEANDEFYRDGRSDTAKYQIIDALRVTSVEWSERDIKMIAAYDIGAARVIKNLKVAFVVVDKEFTDKLEKYMDISRKLNSSWQFKGFQDMNNARAWIDA